MPGLSASTLTSEDASALCAAIIAREETRLSELAAWIIATNGPLAELDGSMDSLVPFWAWAVEFARQGLPGIPLGACSQWFIPTEDDQPTEAMKVGYAADTMAHYLMIVCRGVDPSAHWDYCRDARDFDLNHTGVRF